MSRVLSTTVCQLTLLGGFDLVHRNDSLPTYDSSARLLAFLALHGRARPVRRTAIAERLWQDSAPGRAPARLRSVLWRLPRPDGRPLVISNAATVQLADFVGVDLWDAEDDAHRIGSGADQLPDVTALSDDLLPEWPEDWVLLERESFRQTRLHALECASEKLCRAGSHAAALQASLTAVACEPLRETAHRRVIEVHLAEGNHAEALRQYHSFRRLLAAELGLAPTVAIRNLVAPLLGRPVDRHVSARPLP